MKCSSCSSDLRTSLPESCLLRCCDWMGGPYGVSWWAGPSQGEVKGRDLDLVCHVHAMCWSKRHTHTCIHNAICIYYIYIDDCRCIHVHIPFHAQIFICLYAHIRTNACQRQMPTLRFPFMPPGQHAPKHHDGLRCLMPYLMNCNWSRVYTVLISFAFCPKQLFMSIYIWSFWIYKWRGNQDPAFHNPGIGHLSHSLEFAVFEAVKTMHAETEVHTGRRVTKSVILCRTRFEFCKTM